MSKAEKILDFAMKMELEARDFYLDSIQRVSRAETRSLLATLAEWERGHYEFLKKQRASVSSTGKWGAEAPLPDEVAGGAGIVNSKTKGAGTDPPLGETSSDFSVLRMALAIETDFSKFYGNAAENIADPKGKEILLMLSGWEEGHQAHIDEQYRSLHREFMDEMGFEPF
ncbi:MAG: ferritin family protein [Thermovirgaceae bacterium]|nr:ferritin family protein [Thermovirgaceae bacterium]